MREQVEPGDPSESQIIHHWRKEIYLRGTILTEKIPAKYNYPLKQWNNELKMRERNIGVLPYLYYHGYLYIL